MSKLQRTDKELTEQDAIELAEAATGKKAVKATSKHNFYWYIEFEYFTFGVDVELFYASYVENIGLKGLPLKPTSFTNKALELGLYEMVE